jgi:hypothetical protein
VIPPAAPLCDNPNVGSATAIVLAMSISGCTLLVAGDDTVVGSTDPDGGSGSGDAPPPTREADLPDVCRSRPSGSFRPREARPVSRG